MKLLKDAVLFAQTYTNISRKDIEVIFHCRRSLLFHNNEPWIKKDSNGDFDVTMGSFDGAEVCDLAGLFMLNELSKKFDKDNIGYTEITVYRCLKIIIAIKMIMFGKR